MASKPKKFQQTPKRESFHHSKSDPWYNLKVWRGNHGKPFGQRGGLREQQLINTPYCEQCKRNGITNHVIEKYISFLRCFKGVL